MSSLVLGALLPSAIVALALGGLVRRLAPRLGLVDRPGARKIHSRAMPTGGGLAIWAAIVGPLAVGFVLLLAIGQADWVPRFVAIHRAGLLSQAPRLWLLLGLGTILMVLGLADDRWGLGWQVRLAVQTAVAAATVACGWRMTLFLDWPWFTAALSVLWIVGLVNSFNMLDNMDGLSAGVAGIVAAALAVVMLAAPNPLTRQPQLFVGGLLLVLVGALVGFLWHNWPRARLFMGDGGAYLVGYLLATITLMATFAGPQGPRHAILAPLCVLAIPLYDTASVVFLRLRAGQNPMVGDNRHFSHRLVALGMSRTQAVATIWLATATCGLAAFVLHQVNLAGAIVTLLLVLCVLLLIALLESAGAGPRSKEGEP